MVSISKISNSKTVSNVVSKTNKVKKEFSINPNSKKSKTLMLTLTALAALNCANVGITRAAQARYDHIIERKAKGLEIDECEEFNLSLQTTKPRVNQSHVGITEDLKVFSEKEINEIGIDKWIEENRDKIDALVAALLEKNHLTGAQIEEVLSREDAPARITAQ